RFNHHHTGHAGDHVLQDDRSTAVVHEHTGIVCGPCEMERFAGAETPVFVVRVHHCCVKVDGVWHWRRHLCSEVRTVEHGKFYYLSNSYPQYGSGNGISKGPGPEIYAAGDVDLLVLYV